MGPVTAHIAGRLAPYRGAFLGGTSAPETSINSPVAIEKGSADQEDEDNKQETDRDKRERERAQLFNKLAA